MGVRDRLTERLERALGLGTTDEPRAVRVSGPSRAPTRPITSTIGARVRLSRDGRDGALARVLLLCQRRGVPVELLDGPNGLWFDGEPISPDALRRRLPSG